MNSLDLISISIRNISRNKIKFILTCVSICIGILSVMLIATVGDIGKSFISHELSQMGIDGISVNNKYTDVESVLSADMADTLQSKFNDIDYAMPVISNFGTFSNERVQGQAVLWGVDESLHQTLKLTSLYGRELNKNDIQSAKKVAIIDQNMANTLYKRDNIVGKEISVTVNGSKQYFEVVGIISNQKDMIDSFLGESSPSFIYVPYTVSQQINQTDKITQIAVRATDNIKLDQIAKDLEYYFTKKSDLDGNVDVQNINSYMDMINNVMNYVTLGLAFIAGISMVVAGIGVSNIMLSSAIERKKEIGIYMAIGASKKQVSRIFLIESIIICLISGIIGVFIGIFVAFGISILLKTSFYVNIWSIIAVVIISVVCGIISGIAPAKKASKLNPIDVLRE